MYQSINLLIQFFKKNIINESDQETENLFIDNLWFQLIDSRL